METLADRSLRVAITGVVPEDDPHVIADMQDAIDSAATEIGRLRANVAALTAERVRWRADNEWLTKDNDRLRHLLKDSAIPFNYEGP